MYIYILGWNVDFGHLEAVNLISANKYSEKQIGYLAVTLFLHEQHELLHLVVNSIRKDLLDHNELNNCLALHAIANVGGREMGEALSGDVHMLLISPYEALIMMMMMVLKRDILTHVPRASQSFVKKKAALTLLRLYRKYPGIVQAEWAERIISLMDDPDMGVALSVTSLVMALAQDSPEEFKGSYVKAAHRLKKIVVDDDYPPDYLYYKVPCPWIQVKLLRLLQYYPPLVRISSGPRFSMRSATNVRVIVDTHVRNLIRQSLRTILDTAMETPKNVQHNNAQNAVLFEAINLIIHLDTEQDLVGQISSKLGKFIQSKETNIRYLGLEAMTHLAARAETLDPIKRHQNIILASLRDRDISVRRKGLDLLYSMCDATNARGVVSELLKYLQSADYAIREEMVLKLAILTEKYAVDVQWYVDISLRLIAMAGDHVSDEVWQRVIQIVTNNDELQEYAARNTLQYIKDDQCHETLIKIGGYVLGEFGHLIADSKGCSPVEQFMALHSKMQGSSTSTKAIILSSFVKFVNLFPEIKPRLLEVFRAYSHTLDSELQQRACEYLTLATLPTDDLLRTVCDEMPPYPERASALLSRLHQKHAGSTDKLTWSVARKNSTGSPQDSEPSGNMVTKRAFTTNGFTSGVNGEPRSPPAITNGSGANDLAGLDMTADNSIDTNKALKLPILPSAAHLSPNWETGYYRLLQQNDGTLYEDVQIRIDIRSEYRGAMGCIILTFTNKSTSVIGSFTTTFDNRSSEHLRIDTQDMPEPNIEAGNQAQQTILFEALNVFEEAPTMRVSYLAGALQGLTLRLPVMIHKFMDTAQLSSDDFFKRWRQIGAGAREAQRIAALGDRMPTMDSSFIRTVVAGLKWGVLDGIDPNVKNIVGASVLHTSKGGKYGCLLRLEPNFETKVSVFHVGYVCVCAFSWLMATTDVSIDDSSDGRVSTRGPLEDLGGYAVAKGLDGHR